MSKASELAARTAGIKPREPQDRAVQEQLKTGPGIFMGATLGREAAEVRADEAEARAIKAELNAKSLNEIITNGSLVRISDLILVEGRRRKLTEQQYESLEANLIANPLVTPVTVNRHPDGKLELVAGYNRVDIYRKNGREFIKADIKEFSADEILPAAFYSNLFAVDLPDFEKYLQFNQIKEATGKDQKTLAKESGYSETLISRIFSFDKLPSEVKSILEANPHLFGAQSASDIGPALTDENLSKVIETFIDLNSGKLKTEKQAVSIILNKKPVSSKSASVDIPLGKVKKYITVTRRDGVVALKCKNAELAEKYELKIINFLKDLIETESKQ